MDNLGVSPFMETPKLAFERDKATQTKTCFDGKREGSLLQNRLVLRGIKAVLEKLEYKLWLGILNSADYVVAQRRLCLRKWTTQCLCSLFHGHNLMFLDVSR